MKKIIDLAKKNWEVILGVLIFIYLLVAKYNIIMSILVAAAVIVGLHYALKGGTIDDVEKERKENQVSQIPNPAPVQSPSQMIPLQGSTSQATSPRSKFRTEEVSTSSQTVIRNSETGELMDLYEAICELLNRTE